MDNPDHEVWFRHPWYAEWRRKNPGHFNDAPESPPERAMMVLLCLSCRANARRAQNCRETWFRELSNRPGVRAFFVIGSPRLAVPIVQDDTLTVPADDGRDLTTKVAAAFRWATRTFDAKYFVKVDDDTYVHPDRMIELATLSSADYIGRYTSWSAPEGGAGGAGYLLSPRAAKIVSRMQREYSPDGWTEDVAVAIALRRGGIAFTDDKRLFWANEKRWWPGPGNQMITAHSVYTAEDMQAIHVGRHGAK